MLSTGEHNKAQDLFFKAAKGVFTDDFLKDRILSMPGSDQSESHAYVNYYLRVIQLFDLHGARECAINTAVTALSIADREDSHVVRFLPFIKLIINRIFCRQLFILSSLFII